jgi:hypothetical protein
MSYLIIENQLFMKKLLFFSLAVFIIQFSVFSQDVTGIQLDSSAKFIDTTGLIAIKKTHFLNILITSSDSSIVLRAPAQSFIQLDHPVLSIREQVAIKTPSNFYIGFSGAGRLYKQVAVNDSLLYFKRIDNNENINYNLGAFWFTSGENIYNYGGYGFWKSNGTIRGFNFKDVEWDVIPTNIEVFAPAFPISSWYDVANNGLYVPYQQILNSGIKGFQNADGVIQEGMMYLNFKSGNWTKIGKVLPLYLNIIRNAKFKVYTSTGYLISDGEDVYMFNFLTNSVSKNENRGLAQSIIRIDYSNVHYYKDGLLNSYNPATGEMDTLVIDESKFAKEPDPFWEITFDIKTLWPVFIGIVLLIIVLFVTAFTKPKKAKTTEFVMQSGQIKKIDITFNQTELALIDLLIEKSIQGATATINEINYVLGIKDKNLGMQKKVRSDVINGINDRFKYATQVDVSLILNVRSETDKRYFEYFMEKEQVKEVQKLINK